MRALLEQILALLKQIFHLLPNPDGTTSTTNPNGDKPPDGGTASWGDLSVIAAALQSTTTGSSVSIDVRSAATGSAAATAPIGVITESGSDVTTTGFNQPGAGDNLTISSGTAGSGALRLTLTVSGNVVQSDPIPWSRTAAVPASDALAPTFVSGLAGVAKAGGIDWALDAPSDPHDGTLVGSGVKNVDLELNGAITILPASAGITVAPTKTNIGSISSPGAPTAVQSGRNWTLTAAGIGIDGTADEGMFLNWAVAGDCSITAKINSFTGTGNVFAPACLMIREDLTQGSKYVALVQLLSSLSQGLQGKQRVVTGGSRATIASLTGSNSAFYVRIERAGDVFSLLYSVDGLAWIALASTTVPMAPAVYIGVLASSQQAGSNVVAEFDDVNPSTSPRLTYSQTTVTATHARVRARDLASPANVGAWSSLTANVTPLGAAGAVKWNPGHYLIDDSYFSSSKRTIPTSKINALPAQVVGWQEIVNWEVLEPTRGNYDLSLLDQLYAVCVAAQKRMVIQLAVYTYNESTDIRTPAYLATEVAGGGIYHKPDPANPGKFIGWAPKLYIPGVMDRLIALWQAIGAHMDSKPWFEGAVTSESDITQGMNTAPGFNGATWNTQLMRLHPLAASIFPTSNFWQNANFLPTVQSDMQSFIASMYAGRMCLAVPDLKAKGEPGMSWGHHVANGYKWNGAAWVTGGINYVDRMGIATDVEDVDMGSIYGYSAQQFRDQSYNFNHDNHIFWSRKNYPLGSNKQLYYDNSAVQGSDPAAGHWVPDLKTFFIAGGNPTHLTAPSFYASVITGGS